MIRRRRLSARATTSLGKFAFLFLLPCLLLFFMLTTIVGIACRTAEQVQTIRKTEKANVSESMPVIRQVIREAYEKKKQARLAKAVPTA